jgi:hypothetical protein
MYFGNQRNLANADVTPTRGTMLNWFRYLKELGRKYSWIIQLSETFQQFMAQEDQCIWYSLSQGGGDAA